MSWVQIQVGTDKTEGDRRRDYIIS